MGNKGTCRKKRGKNIVDRGEGKWEELKREIKQIRWDQLDENTNYGE